ncbi:MAG: hypothetical protein A3G39_05925 [Deltaproteobacteria bacterium RIFCSPLOWO2_12_FULL_43_16]|nr:MAG: hypothetical protein A2Z89_03495 [Deltaproteobacteria bacterium GWA2_43_19]OGQ11638.1 MAG: hypothetical protein A3D30_02520 [Deltaproteobacteria bacterium RIFCSPHIGHO2_02_FULL_43_33]OGQ60685.1 MAG: hypothetical protein A3G39_05925 [Deltaproteobacteria bacterium RIFCSPLOWO2_12_FULL_43_16]HBR17808.1 hypothetical protein [Deltaproteobacteria bacterium]
MLISAYAFGGTPEKAVKKAFSEADIYLTHDLLKEYRDVPLALEAEGKINHLQFKTLCCLNVVLKQRQTFWSQVMPTFLISQICRLI